MRAFILPMLVAGACAGGHVPRENVGSGPPPAAVVVRVRPPQCEVPCEREGLCVTFDDGPCMAGSARDCRNSAQACGWERRCTIRTSDRTCVVGPDDYCEESRGCLEADRCAKDPPECPDGGPCDVRCVAP